MKKITLFLLILSLGITTACQGDHDNTIHPPPPDDMRDHEIVQEQLILNRCPKEVEPIAGEKLTVFPVVALIRVPDSPTNKLMYTCITHWTQATEPVFVDVRKPIAEGDE